MSSPYMDEVESLIDEFGLSGDSRDAAGEIWEAVAPLYEDESYSPTGVAAAVIWRASLAEEGYTQQEVAREVGVDTKTLGNRWTEMRGEVPDEYAPQVFRGPSSPARIRSSGR